MSHVATRSVFSLGSETEHSAIDRGIAALKQQLIDRSAHAIGYQFNQTIDFRSLADFLNLSINNLFDEEPPVAYGSRRGFDSINHNALGATYRVSFTYFFE